MPNDEIEKAGEVPKPKVVSMFTREPLKDVPQTEPTDTDEHSIQVLENLLTEFKAGRYRGVAVVAGIFDDKGRMTECATFSSDSACENALSFIGGVSMLKRNLMDEWEGLIPMIDDDQDPTG